MRQFDKETTENLFDFYRGLADGQQVISSAIHGIDYVKTKDGGWPDYFLGGIVRTEDELADISRKVDEGVCPAFWLRESIPQKNQDDILLSYRFRQINFWRGMHLQRDELFNALPPFPGIIIDRVSGDKELIDWISVVNNEIGDGRKIVYKVFRPVLDLPGYDFFKIQYRKKVVSTILLFRKNDVAGIYMVSTLQWMRNKGLGSWIIKEAIDYCIRKGFYKFVLHSTSAGYPVYKKLGFEENIRYGIYWKVGKY